MCYSISGLHLPQLRRVVSAFLAVGTLGVSAGIASHSGTSLAAATGLMGRDTDPPAAALGLAGVQQAQLGPVRGPVFVPDLGSAECDGRLAVQNLDAEPLKAAVLLFEQNSAECSGPLRVVCGGLLAPGASWHFQMAGSQQARSAVVVGLSAKTRAELGLAAPDDVAADALCTTLRVELIDCLRYGDFLEALMSGEDWVGWPLASVAGLAVGAEVELRCPSREGPGTTVSGSYSTAAGGLAAPELLQQVPAGAEVWVQNAGAVAANVSVEAGSNVGCETRACPGVTLAPGRSAMVPAGCITADGWNMRLTSDGPPLVSAATLTGTWMTLETGEPLFQESGTPRSSRWVGPLVFDRMRGWETTVAVTNLGESAATAKVEFMDGAGHVVADRSVALCGRATLDVPLPVVDDWAGHRVGSIAVTSEDGARLRGLVTSYPPRPRFDGQAASYRLVADPTEFALASGSERPAALLLPLVEKDFDGDPGGASELAISNPSREPGWIDAALLFYDQNALVSVMCHTLVQGETRYLNLDALGAADVGFRGSLVIVPTAWGGASGDVHAGVAAVGVHRFRTRLDEDIAGDEMAAAVGVRARVPTGILEQADGSCRPGGSFVRSKPTPRFLPRFAEAVSYAPALSAQLTLDSCESGLTVSNTAASPRTGVVLLMGQTDGCSCGLPLRVLSTDSIAPGGSWALDAAQLPPGATSAAVYGFASAQTASEVVAYLAGQSTCDAVRELHLSFAVGGQFHGIDLQTASSGLHTTVERDCPSLLSPGVRVETEYAAPNHPVIVGGDTVRSLAFAVAEREGNTFIYVQNVGFGCTDVAFRFKAQGDCLRERMCRIENLGSGESAVFHAWECVGPGFRGSVVIEAREPLAITAEWIQDDGNVISYPDVPGDQPADVSGDGVTNAADLAAVQSALGAIPGAPAWNERYDLRPDGIIDLRDVGIVAAAQCRSAVEDAAAPPARADQHVLVPLVMTDDEACSVGITVQNLGVKETGVVMVFWGNDADASCAAPIAILCSPPIRPGASWFLPASDIEVEVDDPVAGRTVKSAIAFSYSTEEVPVDLGFEEDAFTLMCDTLRLGVLGDCADYRSFKAAWDTGGPFAGVPQGLIKGSPIAVTVTRDCPEGETLSVEAYSGVGTSDLSAGSQWLPLVVRRPFMDTTLLVQNDGAQTATVQATYRHQDDCSVVYRCQPLEIAPGSSEKVACEFADDSQGSVRIESTVPVAAMAFITSSLGATTATYTALRPVVSDALGRTASSDHLVVSGPLAGSPDGGADTSVQVVNFSSDHPAHVQAVFRDANGSPYMVLEDEICADGSQTFFVPIDGIHEVTPGSVEVRSVGYRAGGMTSAVPIGAIALTSRWDHPARRTQLSLAINELAAGALTGPSLASKVEVTPAPGETLEAASPDGVGVLAVGGLQFDPQADAMTELVLANRIGVSGHTDVAITAFAGGEPVTSTCVRLAPLQTVTITPAQLNLPPGFKGAAVISAVEWTHAVVSGGEPRQLVGLSAELIRRGPAASDQAPGEMGSVAAHALLGHAGPMMADVTCGSIPTATPSTAVPTPDTTWSVMLPRLPQTRRATPTASQ